MSIKIKLFLFFTLWAVGMAGLLWFSFYYNSTFEAASAIYLDDYYNTNSFINHSLKAQTLLDNMLREPTEESIREEYARMDELIAWELAQFSTDFHTGSIEKYLLAQGTRNLHASYKLGVAQMLGALDKKQTSKAIKSFHAKVSPPLGYMQAYARQMMGVSLSEGQEFYATRRVESQRTRGIMFITAILMLLGGSMMGLAAIRSIVTPILKLSQASREIAAGHFDVTDVEPETRDEVYELACAFNSMKHSMRALVADLRDKNELERQLYQQTTQHLQTQKLLEQAKMSQLRSQIKPHFLFNTLNIISRTARLEQAPKTEGLIKSLAMLLRHVLKTDDRVIPLAREVDMIDEYMRIQTTRFGERTRLYWRVQPGMDATTVMIPAFTLQPLVENAIIHGLEPKVEGGAIRIRIHLRGDILHVIISDNGQGMTHSQLERLVDQTRAYQGNIAGIGVGNVSERIKLLDPENRFRIHSRLGKGTSIQMLIRQQEERHAENSNS